MGPPRTRAGVPAAVIMPALAPGRVREGGGPACHDDVFYETYLRSATYCHAWYTPLCHYSVRIYHEGCSIYRRVNLAGWRSPGIHGHAQCIGACCRNTA